MQSLTKIFQELVKRRSITPSDAGVQSYIEELLSNKGYKRYCFSKNEVTNSVFAKDLEQVNILFIGHTDVVPPGDLNLWDSDPFPDKLEGDKLCARGACDMKGAIAAMLAVMLETGRSDLGLALTSDEEGPSIYGSKIIVEDLQHMRFPYAIVGEPTSLKIIGDHYRIRRRGSLCGTIEITSEPGHSATLESNKNAGIKLTNALAELSKLPILSSCSYNITHINFGDPTYNVVAPVARAHINIRFPETVKLENLQQELAKVVSIKWQLPSLPYKAKDGKLAAAIRDAMSKLGVESKERELGGTSDGRFFQKICDELVELGLKNETIHKPNEFTKATEVLALKSLYIQIIDMI